MKHLPVSGAGLYLVAALIVALAGVPDAAAQFTLRAGPDPLTMDQIISLGKDDLNDFWGQEFSSAGWTYTPPPSLYWYDAEVETSCGTALLGNAFYCTADHSIYYDLALMTQIYESETFGDFGMLTVLAHEWSHAIQAQLADTYLPLLSAQKELQADCFAGAYARFLNAGKSTRLRLEEGDLEEGATLLYALGDDLPWFDADAHGSPYDRSLHFVIGKEEGIDACFPLNWYQDDESAFWMSYPRSWQVKHEDTWSADGWTYYKSFLTAPQHAEHAELNGYLSEGIRMVMQLPQRGNVWKDEHQASWTAETLQSLLDANPAFYVVDSTAITLAGYVGARYWLEGTDERISEPERTSFIFVTAPKFLLRVELTSPASRYDYYMHRLDNLLGTVTLFEPQAPE